MSSRVGQPERDVGRPDDFVLSDTPSYGRPVARVGSTRTRQVQAVASRSTISVSRSGEVAMLRRTWPVEPGA